MNATQSKQTQHTPGPWDFSGPCWQHSFSCWTQTIRTPKVAEGLAVGHSAGGQTRDEAEANARLIAAAPDLLNALTALANVAEARGIPVDAARAAIARAEGR